MLQNCHHRDVNLSSPSCVTLKIKHVPTRATNPEHLLAPLAKFLNPYTKYGTKVLNQRRILVNTVEVFGRKQNNIHNLIEELSLYKHIFFCILLPPPPGVPLVVMEVMDDSYAISTK